MSLKTGKIIKNTALTEDVFELTVETTTAFGFAPGQFITIKIDDKTPPCFRAYSLNSAPAEDQKTFSLCVKLVNGGRGSNWLINLKPDEQINFLGPSGKFLFTTPPEKSALFIATGTGIAPFKAIIEDQLKKNTQQKLHLLFGVRHEKDIFYKNLFEEWALQHFNFTFDLTLSRPETDWQGHHGRVTDILEKIQIDPNNTEVYICGLKNMIHSVSEMLKLKGLNDEAIHFEKYD